MKANPLIKIALISVLVAILVVVIFKILGYGNSTVIGGSVAGGIAGAMSSNYFKGDKEKLDSN